MAIDSPEIEKNLYIYQEDHVVRTGLLKYYDPLLYSDLYSRSLSSLNIRSDTLPSAGSLITYSNRINVVSLNLTTGSLPYQSEGLNIFQEDHIVRTGLLLYYDPLLYSDLYTQSLSYLNTVDHTLPLQDVSVNLFPHVINAVSLNLEIPSITSYDWYVNSIQGNDSNNGRSSISPFKTISKLLDVLSTEESVGLARNSEWREQFTFPDNNISVYAYGSGVNPLLMCDNVVDSGSWTKTGGRTNIYQFSGSTNFIPSEPSFISIWENNVRFIRVSDLATLDTTQSAYYCANDDTTTPVIYVHTSDSSNPASNGKTYEYPARNAGIYGFSKSGLKIVDINSRRNLSNNGSFIIGRSGSLIRCVALEGGKHNILYADGTTLIDCLAYDAYYTSSATMYVYNENSPQSLGINHTRCLAIMPDTSMITSIQGFYGHNNISGSFGNVVYDDCVAENCGIAFGGVNAINFIANGGNSKTCPIGYQFSDSSQNNYINNFSHIETISGRFNRLVHTVSPGITVNMNGGSCVADKSSSNTGMFYDNNNATVFNVYNGHYEFTNIPAAGVNIFYSTVASNISASGNHYVMPSTFGLVYYLNSTSASLVSNYNNFSKEAQWNNYRGTAYGTITAWKAISQDVNSTVG